MTPQSWDLLLLLLDPITSGLGAHMASVLWQSFDSPRNLGEAVRNYKETGKVVDVSCTLAQELQ